MRKEFAMLKRFPLVELDRFFEPFFRPVEKNSASTFSPLADVVEFGDRYEFAFDLPGVSVDSLEITAHEGVLTVKASKPARELEEEGASYRILERTSGEYERSFRLPKHIDDSNVNAKLTDGVLTIVVSKKPEVQPRKIQVDS